MNGVHIQNANEDACNQAPAYSPYTISVGAYTSNFTMAEFSNWGDCVDVWAPGTNIRSAVADCDDCYENWAGICIFLCNTFCTVLYNK